MMFDEAVNMSFPRFRQEALNHPDKLIAMVSIRYNPMELDGPGRISFVVAPDLSNLKEIMKVTEVLFFIWKGDLYQVTRDKTLVFVDWMQHGVRLA